MDKEKMISKDINLSKEIDMEDLEKEDEYDSGFIEYNQNDINTKEDSIDNINKKIKQIDENQEQLAWAVTVTQEQVSVQDKNIQEIAKLTDEINTSIQKGLEEQQSNNILDIDYYEIKKRVVDEVLKKVKSEIVSSQKNIDRKFNKKIRYLYIVITILFLMLIGLATYQIINLETIDKALVNKKEKILTTTKNIPKGTIVYCGKENTPIPSKGGKVLGYLSSKQEFFFFFKNGDKQIKCTLKPFY